MQDYYTSANCQTRDGYTSLGLGACPTPNRPQARHDQGKARIHPQLDATQEAPMALILRSPFRQGGWQSQELLSPWSALSLLDTLNPWPPLELRETATAVVVTVQLPGIDPQQVQVQATPHSLTLSGQQRSYYRDLYGNTMGYGQFDQTIPLPVRVQDGQMQVAFHQGMLVVTLPKAQGWRDRFYRTAAVEAPGGLLRDRPWTAEVRELGRRMVRGWRHMKHWLGHQCHRLGSWLGSEEPEI